MDINQFKVCEDCLCFAARRVARAVTQRYDRSLRPSGLRATQFTILVLLILGGKVPVSQLAANLGVERTTLTRNLRPLIARDFVRSDGGSDKRVRVVEITEQGIAAAENALPYWQKAQLELTSKVGTAALKSFEQIQSSAS